ncbi:helix-turn-helix domain-containing protein [bacterium]|nr:helix-turn-helix domain-containing protein [bacterium]
MQVICIEDEAFFAMIEQVVERLSEKYKAPIDRWIDTDEAMNILRISSPTTLLKFRNEGCIRYSQPTSKLILYDRVSIEEFLESKAREKF